MYNNKIRWERMVAENIYNASKDGILPSLVQYK